ncbi:MAG: YqaJ viral recombinase family protein, partial [Shewanella oncorhynchi]
MKDRSTFIGGSDVAAILGVCEFGTTPFDVWNEKVNGMKKKIWISESDLDFRKKLEVPIMEHFRDKIEVIDNFRHDIRYVSKKYPFLSCQLDGESDVYGIGYNSDKIENTVNIEVQTTSDTIDDIEKWIPENYRLQMQFGMWVTEREFCHLFVLGAGLKLRHCLIRADKGFETDVVQKLVRFWYGNILTKTPPPQQENDDFCSADTIFVTQEQADILQLNKIAETEGKAFRKEAEEIKDRIRQQATKNSVILCGNTEVAKISFK